MQEVKKEINKIRDIFDTKREEKKKPMPMTRKKKAGWEKGERRRRRGKSHAVRLCTPAWPTFFDHQEKNEVRGSKVPPLSFLIPFHTQCKRYANQEIPCIQFQIPSSLTRSLPENDTHVIHLRVHTIPHVSSYPNFLSIAGTCGACRRCKHPVVSCAQIGWVS